MVQNPNGHQSGGEDDHSVLRLLPKPSGHLTVASAMGKTVALTDGTMHKRDKVLL